MVWIWNTGHVFYWTLMWTLHSSVNLFKKYKIVHGGCIWSKEALESKRQLLSSFHWPWRAGRNGRAGEKWETVWQVVKQSGGLGWHGWSAVCCCCFPGWDLLTLWYDELQPVVERSDKTFSGRWRPSCSLGTSPFAVGSLCQGEEWAPTVPST